MRDVYNRRKKLSDWIEKVNQDLDRSDRTDVLKFVEYMKYNANAILWIVRCITALISTESSCVNHSETQIRKIYAHLSTSLKTIKITRLQQFKNTKLY